MVSIVLIGGNPNSGKTTLARSFLNLSDTHVLSLDKLTHIFLATRLSTPARIARRVNIAGIYTTFTDVEVLNFVDTIFQFLDNPYLHTPFLSTSGYLTLNKTVVIEGYFLSAWPQIIHHLEKEFLKRGHTNILSIHASKNKKGMHKVLIGSDEYDVTNGAYADVLKIVENMRGIEPNV